MDLVSHALMGTCIAAATPEGLTWRSAAMYAAASLAPDLFFVPLGLALGRANRRLLWIPRAADWMGCRARYPRATALSWDAPYSILGASLAMLALGAWSWWLALAYGLHIAVDYPTHHGEWAVRPLFPFSKRQWQGFSSAWEWPLPAMALAWAVLGLLLVLLVALR